MTVLSPRLRKTLETAIREARIVAEDGADDAIKRLGIAAPEAPTYLSEEQKALRRRFRAHARSLGDSRDPKGEMTTARLREAAGYELWHRMLFGRFLMERHLLLHPEFGVPISMAEAQEIAAEDKNHFPDEWAVAEHFAAPTLPMVFKPDDPVLALQFDPYFHARLRALLTGLPGEVFEADDSLGWTYQFWRAAEKDAVNKSGVKIGAAELPAVTQLFTEPYMVKFLLHNTLGAWWAGKVLAAKPDLGVDAVDEQALRNACALPGLTWEYLRFVRGDEGEGSWRPAAGTFPGWPDRAADITFCDPCCGSGHFLVEAFAILAALRRAEEGLSPEETARAVLRENLHGLEIDGRCVQIAAFNVALATWRLAGSPIAVPLPHIPWVGAPPPLPRQDFIAMANGDDGLRAGITALHDLFSQAPLLGSLIEPRGGDLGDYWRLGNVEPLLEKLLSRARRAEPEVAEGAIAARGMVDAALILSRRYTLQSTNVPFLGRGRQAPLLADFIGRVYPEAKGDLATTMLVRMIRLAVEGGTVTAVTPQNWLFLGGYKKLRKELLEHTTLIGIGILGEHGFDSAAAAGAFAALIALSATKPLEDSTFAGLDANDRTNPAAKAELMRTGDVRSVGQTWQHANPDCRIGFSATHRSLEMLSSVAECYQGVVTGDMERFVCCFWEQRNLSNKWVLFRTAAFGAENYQGVNHCILWENGSGRLHDYAAESRDKLHDMHESGNRAWGKTGVAINRMRGMGANYYYGEIFDNNVAVIFPKKDGDIKAITSFCFDDGFTSNIRSIDRALKVTNATLLKTSFAHNHWSEIGGQQFVEGLPEPFSSSPTEGAFHGHPAPLGPGIALHVVLARLAGYSWPAESDPNMRLSTEARVCIAKAASLPTGDSDGLLCVPPVAGMRPLAERLRDYLTFAFGADWSNTKERQLIAEAAPLPPRTGGC